MMLGNAVVGEQGEGPFRQVVMEFSVGDGGSAMVTASTSAGTTDAVTTSDATAAVDTTIDTTSSSATTTEVITTTEIATTETLSTPIASTETLTASTGGIITGTFSTTDSNTQLFANGTTYSPTISPPPSTDPWATFNPRHSKFCGPKIVGGYLQAVDQCSPMTMCGLKSTSDHYGANGNDCPKGMMCFSDIVCMNGPNAVEGALSGRGMDLGENIEERTSGGIKVGEVSLIQDYVDEERWFPKDVGGDEEINALNSNSVASSSERRAFWGWFSVLGVVLMSMQWILV
jgi:hypothetical protein